MKKEYAAPGFFVDELYLQDVIFMSGEPEGEDPFESDCF